jgi:predicted metal-dependent phosphoesterase TrpH
LRRRLRPTDAVDLHLHTLASDGFWTTAALIDYLAERNFAVAAVCDHDTQDSVAEAIRLGEERGITVIPGVEMTCAWNDRQVHLLVYGIDPRRTDPVTAPFQAVLAEIETLLRIRGVDAMRRFESSGRALPSLNEAMGGRALRPYHVLRAAIKDGHGKELKDTAELLVELGGHFTGDLPLEQVVAAAHESGGICVIAHPGRGDSVGLVTEQDIDTILQTIPIDGLEAHYRSYSDADTALYRRLADERGLLISSGSDSHGPNRPDPRAWQAIWSAGLLARLGIDVLPAEDRPVWEPGMDNQAVVPAPEPAVVS